MTDAKALSRLWDKTNKNKNTNRSFCGASDRAPALKFSSGLTGGRSRAAEKNMALIYMYQKTRSAICYGKRGLTEPLNQETNSIGWELVLSVLTRAGFRTINCSVNRTILLFENCSNNFHCSKFVRTIQIGENLAVLGPKMHFLWAFVTYFPRYCNLTV